jgi:hypothetical protein
MFGISFFENTGPKTFQCTPLGSCKGHFTNCKEIFMAPTSFILDVIFIKIRHSAEIGIISLIQTTEQQTKFEITKRCSNALTECSYQKVDGTHKEREVVSHMSRDCSNYWIHYQLNQSLG